MENIIKEVKIHSLWHEHEPAPQCKKLVSPIKKLSWAVPVVFSPFVMEITFVSRNVGQLFTHTPNSMGGIWQMCNSFFFPRFYLFIFREGKGGRKRGRERPMCGCLSLTPLLGTWPETHSCALTGNRTGDPLVHRPVLNPLSHTSQKAKCVILEHNKQSIWPELTRTSQMPTD